uniref:Organic solute transporter subunit alpha n=1 Tax=Panagrolaimus sp. JU765 TaxID=591449 RepID=A0AC34PX41_9BILA
MWTFDELFAFIIAQIRSLVLPGSLETNCTLTDAVNSDPAEFYNDQPSSKHFLTHLSHTQKVLLIIGSVATFLLISIGFGQARLISKYVSEKKHRKLLLVLAFLFPGAAGLCLTGMFVPRAATINASLGLFIFIVAITSLIRLCRYLTGGWAQLAAELDHKGHRMSLMNPPFCCILPCLPRLTATQKNLRWLELAVCQAPLVRGIVLLSQIIAIAEYRENANTLVQICDLTSLVSLLLLVFAFHTLSRAAGVSF